MHELAIRHAVTLPLSIKAVHFFRLHGVDFTFCINRCANDLSETITC
jgi:hypothetical protein